MTFSNVTVHSTHLLRRWVAGWCGWRTETSEQMDGFRHVDHPSEELDYGFGSKLCSRDVWVVSHANPYPER